MPDFDAEALKGMLSDADAAPHPQQKGEKFELALQYVFECVPGSVVRRNSRSHFGTEQVDLAVANQGGFPSLPSKFLVECKNYDDPVDSKAVGYFLFICVSRSAELAVVVAANGLTGNAAELSHAHALAIAAQALNCRLIVITKDDLLGLTCANDIVRLLEDRHLAAFSTGGIGAK